MNPTTTAPPLTLMTRVHCDVGELVSLGATADGERRCVALLGGHVEGPELNGVIVPGGTDWQLSRADGVLEIDAHYMIRTPDGALVEVRSQGLRHGPPEVIARLLRGEPVDPSAYFFRTVMRLHTGHPDWQHLNKVMALASGRREARQVVLDVWRIG